MELMKLKNRFYIFIIIFASNVNQVVFSYDSNVTYENCTNINGWMSNANETCDDLKEYGICNTTDFNDILGHTESTACCHCENGGLYQNKMLIQESNSEVTCFDDPEWKTQGTKLNNMIEEQNDNTTTNYIIFTCEYFKDTPEASCKRYGSYIDVYGSGLSGNEACCW